MKTPFSPIGDRPLRGALVGAGGISVFHMHGWRNIPGVEIIALADRDRSRAVALGGEFGIGELHVYANLAELLDRERPDFVDIATPPDAHCDNVLTATARGVHVLCQKPFATSLDEARRMIAACDAAKVRCIVNENWRWRAWYREVKRLIDAGAIGAPRSARFTWHADDALPGPDGTCPSLLVKQPYAAHQERLILFEWGIHLIDVLRFFFGDVRRVSATTSRVSPAVVGEDTVFARLEFDGGIVGEIDISWGSPIPAEKRFERGMVEPLVVEGTDGRIELDPFQGDTLVIDTKSAAADRRPARGELSRPSAYQDCFDRCQRHFIDCLRSGHSAENEALDNWNTLAAVFAAYELADTGRLVAVPARP